MINFHLCCKDHEFSNLPCFHTNTFILHIFFPSELDQFSTWSIYPCTNQNLNFFSRLSSKQICAMKNINNNIMSKNWRIT